MRRKVTLGGQVLAVLGDRGWHAASEFMDGSHGFRVGDVESAMRRIVGNGNVIETQGAWRVTDTGGKATENPECLYRLLALKSEVNADTSGPIFSKQPTQRNGRGFYYIHTLSDPGRHVTVEPPFHSLTPTEDDEIRWTVITWSSADKTSFVERAEHYGDYAIVSEHHSEMLESALLLGCFDLGRAVASRAEAIPVHGFEEGEEK